jgi:hypothetical protein
MFKRMAIMVVVLVLSTVTFARAKTCRHECLVKIGTFTELGNFQGGNTTGFDVRMQSPTWFSQPLTIEKITFAIKGNTVGIGPYSELPNFGFEFLVIGGPGVGDPSADCTANDCIFAAFQFIVGDGQPFTIIGKDGTQYTFYGVGEGYITPPFGRATIQIGDKANIYLHLISTTSRW